MPKGYSISKKIKKQELKKDKIMESIITSWDWMRNHIELVGGIILGIVIFAFAIALYIHNKKKSEAEALIAFDSALSMYSQSDASKLSGVYLQLEGILKKYPATESGKRAILYMGHISYFMKDYDKAISHYQSYLKVGDKDEILQGYAYAGIAACLEDKNDFSGAAMKYEEIAKKFKYNSFLATRNLLSAGRCYEAAKSIPKAREVYRQIIENYPNSPLTYPAKTSLALLPPP